MKQCSDCNQTKPFTDFVPKPSCKDGYEPRCRNCRSIRYNKSTPDLVFKKIYLAQVHHSISRGHPAPNYLLDDLKTWADKQPHLHKIWNDFVNSNYSSKLVPSIDRIDDSLPYTLNNIQLMTWEENRAKGARSKRAGLVNANQRAVRAINPDGTIYRDFISIMDAVRHVNGRMWGIASVANNKPITHSKGGSYVPQSYKGFKWEWI